MGKFPSPCSAGGVRARRSACRIAAVVALLSLSACSPVETWRDLTGASRNDPDPETTPNTQNLAAGEASDYPNLATVPPPPSRALTAADREKLTQSLIADRANARHTDEQLRAGFPAISAPPPPPPPPVPPITGGGDAGAAASGASPAPQPSAAPAAAVGPMTERAAGQAAARPGQGLRKEGEPPEPGPMESSLEVPQARATPRPEQIEPAPPPPQLPAVPNVANALAGRPTAPVEGAPPVQSLSPDAAAPAAFQPPPPAPELPALPPTRAAATAPAKTSQKPSPPVVSTPVAEIKFGAASTSLTDDDRRTLATVVPLYQQNPGKIRIVGYAGPTGGAVEQLNSFRAALDRAQAVAAALTQAGIPSDKIQTEAAPAGANSGEGRAEILLEH
jgi:outer membrane protein OmpA-like peptidoglycan-associated protein